MAWNLPNFFGNTAKKIEPTPELKLVPKRGKTAKDPLEKMANKAEAKEIEREYRAELAAERRKIKQAAPEPKKVIPFTKPVEEEVIDLSGAFDTPEELKARKAADWQAEMEAAINEQLETDRLAKEEKVREMVARREAAELKRKQEAAATEAERVRLESLGTDENPIELEGHELEYPDETAFFEPPMKIAPVAKEKPRAAKVADRSWDEMKDEEIATQTPVLTGKPIEPVLTGTPLGTEDNPIELDDSDIEYIQPIRKESRKIHAKVEGPTAAEIQMHQEFYSAESEKYTRRAQLMERSALSNSHAEVASAQLKTADNARAVARLADYLANSYQTAELFGQPIDEAENQAIIAKLELATAEFEASLKDIRNERLADEAIADLTERRRWKLQAEVDKLRKLKDKTDNNVTNLQIAMSGVKRSLFGWLKNKFSSESSRLMDEINYEEKINEAEAKMNEINNQLETLTAQLNALVSPEERQQSPSEEKAAKAKKETDDLAGIKQMQKSGQLRGTGGSSGAGQGKLQGISRRATNSNYRSL